MKAEGGSYQADLHRQGFFCDCSAFQLLQGFALVGNSRVIVLVLARLDPMAAAEAGVGAPVGQTVAPSEVTDGERRAGGDVEVWKLSQVVVVLRQRIGKVLLLLPDTFICLSGVGGWVGGDMTE